MNSRLLALQRRLHRSLSREADQLLGPQAAEIRRYEAKVRSELLQARPVACAKGALIGAVRKAQVTLVADFHTFPQAQRTALRIAREAHRPDESWALGLEMVSSRYQRELDQFARGALGAGRFLERIRYREEWGFPWAHYEPLVAWARDHGLRLLALNRPRELVPRSAMLRRAESGASIAERDRWAAGVIADALADTGTRVLALMGDLHLGAEHLPARIAEIGRAHLGHAPSVVTVHQNFDPYYWRLARARRAEAAALSLGAGRFCVLSGTPWAKLQSIVSWAEGDLAETDHGEDYLSALRTVGDRLAGLFRMPAPDFGAITVRTASDADALSGRGALGLDPSGSRLVRALVAANQRFYLPSKRVAYLGSPSPNGIAEAAGYCLLASSPAASFYQVASGAAFAFLGSLILNPKRKCDLPLDHRRRLSELERGAREAYPSEGAARTLALDFARCEARYFASGRWREPRAARSGSAGRSPAPSAAAAILAARSAGRALGRRLHSACSVDRATPEGVAELCRGSAGGSAEARDRYLALLALAARAPDHSRSKSERL